MAKRVFALSWALASTVLLGCTLQNQATVEYNGYSGPGVEYVQQRGLSRSGGYRKPLCGSDPRDQIIITQLLKWLDDSNPSGDPAVGPIPVSFHGHQDFEIRFQNGKSITIDLALRVKEDGSTEGAENYLVLNANKPGQQVVYSPQLYTWVAAGYKQDMEASNQAETDPGKSCALQGPAK